VLGIVLAGLCRAADAPPVQPTVSAGKAEKPKQPNVPDLTRKANALISEAQDFYINGDSKKAMDTFREAIKELVRIELEHPAWATSPDFAPIRFRKALCETEIDRIMLEDAQSLSRTVAVTDTRMLETKRAERKRQAVSNQVAEATVKLSSKKIAETEPQKAGAEVTVKEEIPKRDPELPLNIKDELEWAKDMLQIDRFADAEQSLLKILKHDPENGDARFLMALSRVQQGQHADALVILDDVLSDRADDEAALLLAAGSYLATGAYAKSMAALDRAMKVQPKRPDAYLNMAWLLLEMNPKALDDAEMYYRQAVKLGASRQRELERRLGIKP